MIQTGSRKTLAVQRRGVPEFPAPQPELIVERPKKKQARRRAAKLVHRPGEIDRLSALLLRSSEAYVQALPKLRHGRMNRRRACFD